MDKVQLQLEATLPELKDLHEKGLFSKNEIDQITKRRTNFETSLIRRTTRKDDYFKYAEYEINLEKLRRVRWKRLGYDKNPPPPSASTYSFPRRIVYILKRATVKFPGDLATWLAYVEYASREGMRKVVANGLTSALQYHPLSPTLYLLSSYHHLHPSAPFPTSIIPGSSTSSSLPTSSSSNDDPDDPDSSRGFAIEGIQPARTTLLLGLRMLPKSRDLWREYIKLELGWVEALRRRWSILGINLADQVNGSTGKSNGPSDDELTRVDGGEGAFGETGEEARKAILGGQLVITAINSALESVSPEFKNSEGNGMAFRDSLIGMFRTYPSPLRKRCLQELYNHLEGLKGRSDEEIAAKARLVVITKGLYDRPYEVGRKDDGGIVLDGEELVEEVGRIGTHIRRTAKEGVEGWSDIAGRWLLEQIKAPEYNNDEKIYLHAILSSLTKGSSKPSAELLILHLQLLEESPNLDTLAESHVTIHHLKSKSSSIPKILTIARSHAGIHPNHPGLQNLRLQFEVKHESDINTIRTAFSQIIKAVTRPKLSTEEQESVISIWLAWANWESSIQEDPKIQDATWRKILRDSLRLGNDIPGLHPALLATYFLHRLKLGESLISTLRFIISTYRPNPTFFKPVFEDISHSSEIKDDMQRLYEAWKATCVEGEDKVDAAIAYGSWLIQHGLAKRAVELANVVRREVRDEGYVLADLDARWKRVLDSAEDREESDSSEEQEDEDVIMDDE